MGTLNMKPSPIPPSGKSGQAIAELVMGLIALVVVFMGMLLIQSLGVMHTQTLMAARLEAGKDALSDQYICRYSSPQWISTWKAAAGQDTYSAHDLPIFGSPNNVASVIGAYAQPSQLQGYLPQSTTVTYFKNAAVPDSLLSDFFLTHGQAITNQPLTAFPFIQWLPAYQNSGSGSIQMQGNAWLTWAHIE